MDDAIRVDAMTELTPMRAAHARAYAALVEANVPRLARWFPWATEARDLASIRAYIATVEVQRARRERNENYVILVDGALAGSVTIHDDEPRSDTAELGYWIGARFGGRGVVTRAVAALCRQAWSRGIHRLEIIAGVENAPSRAVAERAGFVFEGVLRERVRTQRGYENAALYARLASDP